MAVEGIIIQHHHTTIQSYKGKYSILYSNISRSVMVWTALVRYNSYIIYYYENSQIIIVPKYIYSYIAMRNKKIRIYLAKAIHTITLIRDIGVYDHRVVPKPT